MNAPAVTNDGPARPTAGIGGLIAILVAIVLGVLIGVFYGKAMWLTGGIDATLDELREAKAESEKYVAEKEQRLEQVKEPQLVRRLREDIERVRAQLPRIDKEIAEITRKRDAAEAVGRRGGLPYFAWEFTKFCGDLFLQTLKLLVIPLVITSMIVGITSLGDIRRLGKLGGWTIFYYMSTAAFAVLLGIVLVTAIQPGKGVGDEGAFVVKKTAQKEGASAVETLLNVVRGQEGKPESGMFPSNIFLAASETNVLALIVFALIFGGMLTTIGSRGQVVVEFFRGANETVMKMVHLVMWFAPVGIFGLVAYNIAKKGGGEAFGAEMVRLGKYVGTVSIGLTLHFLVLTCLLWILARRNPLTYLLGVLRALLTAVTTASSSATLPISIECVEENNGVSNRSAAFVLPLGATINMDGTALYEAVAVIFIAQSLGIDLSTGQLLVIFLTATLAAVGAAGIPEAGLVTMVIVLQAVGLPISGIGIILAIDWFLDRLRTTVNVYGDCVGAGIIDRFVIGREHQAAARATE